MKKSLFFLLLIGATLLARAQNLQVQSNDKGLYLTHKVAPKETFYSVGRLYHLSPKDIAAFNGLDMTQGLNIGQEVRIPLSAANFSQDQPTGTPVYYVVGEKEGLYRVSLKHNKVLMANLRKWNNLTNDNIQTGQKLVVGYLAGGNGVPAVVPNAPVEKKPEVVRTPVAEPVKEKKEAVVAKTEEKSPEPRPIEPEVKKPAPAPRPAPIAQGAVNDANGGYFKASFEKQGKAGGMDQTVTAGIFKTASGWQDAKYYALMDGVEPGTIVRIVNPTNNKAVYAKVLGQMSGIRQNQGYDLRLSNAAATALEVSDMEKFVVRVNY